jgi:GH25 family lysozyme M1 (1,4-beta-N-acetylmuramidase)
MANELLPGVDVSSFQGPPADWVGEAGAIVWAAVKLTELQPNGTRYINPDAQADWDWLHAHSKGRIAYLFGHPSTSAAETASFFVSELDKIGLRDTDAVCLDLEVTDGEGPSHVSAWADNVQSELKSRLHRPPLLYTFIDFAKEGNCAGLGRYPLWIADPSSPRGHPRVPEPWTTWSIQQFDISGNIDRNVADYASQQVMFDKLGKQTAPKPPEPGMTNIGGNVSAVAATVWPNGRILVAGIGTDAFVWRRAWSVKGWGRWQQVSPTKAKGSLALIVTATDGGGKMYYIEPSGETIEITTTDYGTTWS